MSSIDTKLEIYPRDCGILQPDDLVKYVWVMKVQKKYQNFLLAAILVFLYPATILSVITVKKQQTPVIESTPTVTSVETTVPESNYALPVLLKDGTVEQMDLDTYITAVVLCEMPAEFEPEALKAQAVVARTYALRREKLGNKHSGAAVCTEPSCCQGYKTEQDYLAAGGKETDIEKIKDAVSKTHAEVLTYNGELIEATYFSCSGGMTEDALAVWGSDVPYLRAVESPGEENAKVYKETVEMKIGEFQKLLGVNTGSCTVQDIRYTNGGGVESVKISGKVFSGTELRKKLKLRSTAMDITFLGDTVTISTKGNGHRVGMSQYGAEAMAVNGKSYREILAHYYSGTELSLMYD